MAVADSAFLHSRRIMTGLTIIAIIALVCFVGPLFYHPSDMTSHVAEANLPPGGGHLLGTDIYGVDVLYQLMIGGRTSLELSFAVAIVSTALGAVYGAIAGLYGGLIDGLMMRIIDTILAVPTFILLLIVASMYTLTLGTIIIALAALSWPSTARLVRGQVLLLRDREFIQASEAQGARKSWIMIHHILPNTFNIVVVNATFSVADAIYALSALSFIGLGPQPPFSDWGTLLTQGVNNLFDGYWWQVYPPLIALVVTVLAFRQIGDAVNDLARGQSVSVRRRRRGLLPFAAREAAETGN